MATTTAMASLLNGLWTHFVMATAMERNSANTYIYVTIATAITMWTVSYICIEPIHDDKDVIAIAVHFV